METRSKRRRLISLSSYDSLRPAPAPDVPATFESLNDDTLTTVLEFVGGKSYVIYAGINKRCKEVYLNTPGMTKETFLYGYGPLSVIKDRYDNSFSVRVALGKGVVFYNRRDVLEWALEERKNSILNRICEVAAREGRLDVLDEVWNYIMNDDEDYKRTIFRLADFYAASDGKVNVLKWVETKGFSINKRACAHQAARYGQLHVLQWLKEEKGLQLEADLYDHAIWGDQLNVMKWFREQEVPWDDHTFRFAAEQENLAILQWLHDEGCPWDRNIRVHESWLEPETLDWLIANGYGDKNRS